MRRLVIVLLKGFFLAFQILQIPFEVFLFDLSLLLFGHVGMFVAQNER